MHGASQELPLAQLVADVLHLDVEISTYDVRTSSKLKSIKDPFKIFESFVPVAGDAVERNDGSNAINRMGHFN